MNQTWDKSPSRLWKRRHGLSATTCNICGVTGTLHSNPRSVLLNSGLFHFVYGASPHQILLHLPIIFASFPHQICFISPTNCFISPTSCFISPTDCFISPTKFSLPHHYFASLCQKLEHNFLIFFPFFHLWSLILNNLFSGNCWSMCPVIVIKWYNPQALVLVQTSLS